ncbi:MAG TPA: DUF3631 domain-containing protein [Thermoanaerobaculia bacterium]|nr:DUF3631 domain-containing protein [Thermoanaerobaculia bacterium]
MPRVSLDGSPILLPLPHGQAGQVGRDFQEHTLLGRIVAFLTDYLVLPDQTPTVIAAWIMASWHMETWDQFPHLGITSPEKRCGKSRLLELLALLCPNPILTSSVSPAALYRLIEKDTCCTLLFDEAQSLGRKGESYAMKELLCASIGKESRVYRCGGKNEDYEPRSFKTYCPKVFALIGPLDGVLADRSIPIEMARKTERDQVQRYSRRIVDPLGKELHDELGKWAAEHKDYVAVWYRLIDPFDIDNDRMADLLMPLQAVLQAVTMETKALEEYARDLDDRDRRQGTQSHGVRLLAACREILNGQSFTPTADLLSALIDRSEEPWHRWNRGEGMNAEALASLLRPYGVNPQHSKDKTQRGYYASNFADAWGRYLTPLESPSNPSSPSMVSKLP